MVVSVGLLTIDFVIVHTNSELLEPRYGFRPAHNLALDFYEALYLILQGKLIVEATKIKDKSLHEICEELERTEKETTRWRETFMTHLEYKNMIPRTHPEAYHVVTPIQLYEHACKRLQSLPLDLSSLSSTGHEELVHPIWSQLWHRIYPLLCPTWYYPQHICNGSASGRRGIDCCSCIWDGACMRGGSQAIDTCGGREET